MPIKFKYDLLTIVCIASSKHERFNRGTAFDDRNKIMINISVVNLFLRLEWKGKIHRRIK